MRLERKAILAAGFAWWFCLSGIAQAQNHKATTRPYEFNSDVEFTLDKGSEIHLDCPDNPYGITEYIVYYHVTGSGEERIGIRAMLESGKRTEWYTAPGSCEAILQQATPTPCLAVLIWQPCAGGLDVSFRASDDKEQNCRTYRQYVLSGKKLGLQFPRLNLIFPDFMSREQAIEDIAFLTEQLKAKHPKPFGRISQEEFGDEIERLKGTLDDQVLIRKFSLSVAALLDAMRKNGTQIVILDLRGNSGGNATMGHMVLARMVDKKYADIAPDASHSWPVKIAVLCDRGTYSPGSFEAMRVKDEGIGIIAGEETGGRASFFGDIEHGTLPNSLLRCGIATGYFPRRAGYDDGRGVLPDVPLDVTLDDSVLVEKICAFIRKTSEEACGAGSE